MTEQRFRSLIAGAWIDEGSERVVENPSDLDHPVGVAVQVSGRRLDEAVEAAQEGRRALAALGPSGRGEVLERAAQELLARRDELGLLLAREEGKALADAVGEVVRAGQVLRFAAGETVRLGGERFDSVRPGLDVEVLREPVGVVGAITPWNFPVAIPAWKLAPALAYGNAVILKPADLVPGSAVALAEILQRAGLPAGALGLMLGRGSEVGAAMIAHPGIDAVTFTGSVEVGAQVRTTATGRGARVQLEMGGKNPLVVLDDADLEVAVETALQGAFFSTGQRCTASSRLVVQEGIHDAFVERLVERMAALRVGDATDPATQIGPVVDAAQLAQDVEYLQIGRDEGAELVQGGRLLERATRGHFLEPGLFVGATNAMRISREEIFGPVACVIKVADYDEALSVANDTPFGLSSGICTQSLAHARDYVRRAQAGMVMVNVPTAGVDFHVPFGGRKRSSYGPREQGAYAREFFTIVKTAYIAPGRP